MPFEMAFGHVEESALAAAEAAGWLVTVVSGAWKPEL